jgi:hypothetical protein
MVVEFSLSVSEIMLAEGVCKQEYWWEYESTSRKMEKVAQ